MEGLILTAILATIAIVLLTATISLAKRKKHAPRHPVKSSDGVFPMFEALNPSDSSHSSHHHNHHHHGHHSSHNADAGGGHFGGHGGAHHGGHSGGFDGGSFGAGHFGGGHH
ncbi:MAG TPA: hypothetical protein VH597_00340 [Verrucomicrobiae bacterium]|jgi:hypothetical protein|nr:hypothetical protein [Verrucomicrobiae bacterium]